MAEEKQAADRYALAWDRVEGELLKKEMSAYKVAVLEAEKIFQAAMEDKDFPGNGIDDRIEGSANRFSNLDKLKYARAMHNKIVTKLGFDISESDAEEIISGYRSAVADLVRIDFKEFPIGERISIFLRRNFYGLPQKTKGAVAALAAVSLAVFFLTETETGRSLGANLVYANVYLYYKIIPAAVFILLVAAAAMAIFYVYQNRKK